MLLKKSAFIRLYSDIVGEATTTKRSHLISTEDRIRFRFVAQTRRVVTSFAVFVAVTCSVLVLNSKFYSPSVATLMFPSFTYMEYRGRWVFTVMFALQLVFLIQVIITQSVLMYFYIGAINQLCSQMEVLQYRLQIICCHQEPEPLLVPRPNLKKGDEIIMIVIPPSVDVAARERELMNRLHAAAVSHNKIIIFKKSIETLFGGPILVFTLINECYLCLLGYGLAIQSESTLVAKVKVVFMIFTSLILTFLHCLYGQKLQTQGEKLSSAIYFVPWYKKSRTFQKCLLFMNEMSKRKITISPYRIKDIGLPLLVQVGFHICVITK
ncbi:hypothetical protein WDU94_006444 [Cyamophila willieti]